jgi:HAD superfamily hydrolase (TIGR01509 family)
MPEKLARPAAAIFDMDGVLVDSNPFHLRKWMDFLNQHGIPYRPEELAGRVLGPGSDASIRFYLGPQLSDSEVSRLSEELEEGFRRVFRPHAKPLPGVVALMAGLRGAGIPLAVASSAMAKNVEFIVDVLGLRSYFHCLVSGDEVIHSKPHPEIYLKTAEKLGVEPAACVTFEDSYAGVESAKRAGMKCVAIASTFSLAELRQHTQADLTIQSFEGLTLATVRQLFEEKH